MSKQRPIDELKASITLTPALGERGGVGASDVPRTAVPGASWHHAQIDGQEPALVFAVRGEFALDVADAGRRAQLVSHDGLLAIREVAEFYDDDATPISIILYDLPAGQPLSALVHGTPLRPESIRAIVARVAEALEAARRKGVRHLNLDPDRVFVDMAADSVQIAGAGVEDAAREDSARDRGALTVNPDVRSLGAMLFLGLTGGAGRFFGGRDIVDPHVVSPRSIPRELSLLTRNLLSHEADDADNPPYTIRDVERELSPWQSLPVTLEAFDPEADAGAPTPLSEDELKAYRSIVAAGSVPASRAELSRPTPENPSPAPAPRSPMPVSEDGDVPSAAAGVGGIVHWSDALDDSATLPNPALKNTSSPSEAMSAGAVAHVVRDDVRGPIPVAGRTTSLAAHQSSPLTAEPADPPQREGARAPGARRPTVVPPSSIPQPEPEAPQAFIPVRGRTESPRYHAAEAPPSLLKNVVGVAMGSASEATVTTSADEPTRSVQSRIILVAALLVVALGLVFAITSITAPLRERAVTSNPSTAAAPPAESSQEEAAQNPEVSEEAVEVEPATLAQARVIYPPNQAQADYPEDAGRLTDGDPGTVWSTQRYNTPDYGRLRTGMGVHLAFDEGGKVTSVIVTPGAQEGGTIELRPVNGDDQIGEPLVSTQFTPGQDAILTLPEPIEARDLVLWAPDLGAVEGGYRLEIAEIRVE